jgi:hypothetical protein
MTGSLQIPAGEDRTVRVFLLPPDVPAAPDTPPVPPATLAMLLGAELAQPAHAQRIRLSDLGDLGLAGFLTEGLEVPDAALAGDLEQLQALRGEVLVIASQAFGGQACTLTPAPGVRLVGAWQQAMAAPPDLWQPPIEEPAILVPPAPPARTARGTGGLPVALLVLAGLAGLGLFLWWTA